MEKKREHKTYGDDVKEQAFALLAINSNVRFVANKLGIPYTTVKTWEKKFLSEREGADVSEKDGSDTHERESEPDDAPAVSNLQILREQMKEKFVKHSWDMIEKGQAILERRILRAEARENEIDGILKLVEGDAGLTRSMRNELITKLTQIKLDNAKDIAVIIGTLYDKQALAAKEPTHNVRTTVRFEDL